MEACLLALPCLQADCSLGCREGSMRPVSVRSLPYAPSKLWEDLLAQTEAWRGEVK